MREPVNRLILAALVGAVLLAGLALWLGLGKPGIADAGGRRAATALTGAQSGALNSVVGPDALLFEPDTRDGGTDPIDAALAITAIQCDGDRKPGRCRAQLVSTLIPGGQVTQVDRLEAVAHGRCRHELRRLAVVVAEAVEANTAFGAHGATPTVAGQWTAVASALRRFVRVDSQGYPTPASGLRVCAPS